MRRTNLEDIRNYLSVPTIIKFLFFILLLSTPFVNGGKGHGAFLFAHALLFLSALFFLFYLSTSKNKTIHVCRWYIFPIGFFLWVTVNLFTTVYLHATLLEWMRLVGYGTFFFILLGLTALDRDKLSSFYQQTVWLVIGVGFVESLVVLWQVLQGKFLQGTMPNSNLVSGYIAFSFIFLFSFLIMRSSSLKTRISLTAILAVMVMALAMIHSRGVFLSLLVAVVLLLKKRPHLLRFGSFLLLVILFVFLIRGSSVDRFLKASDPYGYRRVAIWQSTLSMIETHPLSGCGLGNYGLLYPRYSLPHTETVLRYGKVTRFAHNEFLDVAATAGIPALIFLLITVFIVVYKGWEGYKKEWSQSWHFCAAYAAFLSCIIHGFVDFNLHLPAISYFCILTAAYILTVTTSYSGRKIRLFRPVTLVFVAFFIILLSGIGTFFIASRYKAQAEEMNSLRFPVHSIVYRYQKALYYNPLDSYYHYELGRLYAKIYGDYKRVDYAERALQEFRAASQLNPEEARFYEKGFYLCGALDMPITHIEPLFREAKVREPHYVQRMVDFAYLHMQKGFYGPAQRLLKEVVRIEPNYLPGYYNLAKIQEQEGHLLAAENLYQYLISRRSEGLEKLVQSDYEQQALAVDWGDIYYRQGLMYIRDKKYSEAVNTFLRAIECNDNNADYYNVLAGAYFQQGKTDLARQYLFKAFSLNPDNKKQLLKNSSLLQKPAAVSPY